MTDDEPSSTKARIAATALILALAAATGLHPTKEAQNPTPPPQEVKTEATEAPKPAGERTEPALKAENPPQRDFSSQDEAKAYLASKLPNQRDVAILTAVIQCESGWEHYRPTGEVKVSSGNVGFGQLNAPTWKAWLSKNYGLDIYKQRDNIDGTVIVYLLSGIAPWEPYSGHCFKPLLAEQGIEL